MSVSVLFHLRSSGLTGIDGVLEAFYLLRIIVNLYFGASFRVVLGWSNQRITSLLSSGRDAVGFTLMARAYRYTWVRGRMP